MTTRSDEPTKKFRYRLVEDDARSHDAIVAEAEGSGRPYRWVRGRKCTSLTSLFDEFAAALQFPLYFGENRDAFEECLTDMEVGSIGGGLVLGITEPQMVLSEADIDLRWLVDAFARVAEDWSRPIKLGEPWDRPAMNLDLILISEQEWIGQSRSVWREAGAVFQNV